MKWGTMQDVQILTLAPCCDHITEVVPPISIVHNYFGHYFCYVALTDWNEFDVRIRVISKFNSFKHENKNNGIYTLFWPVT